ncbi:MAG: glycosyltransferase family 2 protein [Acidobacteria bacterium]|nr:glycosyltransferase family 2 protein [Acidobacteriota bacterium]
MSLSNPVSVSVIICAYTAERWDSLVRALEGVSQQTLQPSDLILAVDHNPDLAMRIIQELKPRFPALTVAQVNTGPSGIGSARNIGISHSHGDLVVFLDDDAAPRNTWLEEIVTPFTDSTVGVVAGHVTPKWMGSTKAPRWFPPEYFWVVGATWRGFGTSEADIRNPIGASMAIRRELLESVGGFDVNIVYGNDETDLCFRIRDESPGIRTVYAPRSEVFHEVSATRQTVRYFFRRCWVEGVAKGSTSERHGRGTLRRELDYCVRYLTTGVIGSLVTLRLGRIVCLVGGFTTTLAGWIVSRLKKQLSK